MLVSRKNFSNDWTVVRPRREHKVKSAGVKILGENQGMSVKLYVKYIPKNQRKTFAPKRPVPI